MLTVVVVPVAVTQAFVVVADVTVRAGMSTDSAVVRQIKPGGAVQVVELGAHGGHQRARIGANEWVSIVTGRGKVLMVPFQPGAQVFTVVADVTVRVGMSTDSAVVRQIKPGGAVQVVELGAHGGHQRARIGANEWVSIVTERGKVLLQGAALEGAVLIAEPQD